jgi:hypothetical protein
MKSPMVLGALLCLGIGLWPQGVVRLVAPAATSISGAVPPVEALGPLAAITRVAAALLAIVAVVSLVRVLLLRGREIRAESTWGCGYAAPTPRMQYTGASFAQPLLAPFGAVLDVKVNQRGPSGYFPREADFDEHTGDPAGERILLPATRHLLGVFSRIRVIQQGRIQLYLAYILATLIALLLWQLGGRPG